MCMLCVEIQKQKMTPTEVARAYAEASMEDGHWAEVLAAIEENVPGGARAVGKELSKLIAERE